MKIDFKDIENLLDDRKTDTTEAWAIRKDGVALRVMSGKSVWKSNGAARSAFTNFISGFIRGDMKESGFNSVGELTTYLIKSGTISIEKL